MLGALLVKIKPKPPEWVHDAEPSWSHNLVCALATCAYLRTKERIPCPPGKVPLSFGCLTVTTLSAFRGPPMNTTEQLVKQAERLQARVEFLQQALHQLHVEVRAHGDVLRHQLNGAAPS